MIESKRNFTRIDRKAMERAQAEYESVPPDERLSFQRYLENAYALVRYESQDLADLYRGD